MTKTVSLQKMVAIFSRAHFCFFLKKVSFRNGLIKKHVEENSNKCQYEFYIYFFRLCAYPYVPILFLLLLFLLIFPSIFFRLTVLIITAVDQIPLLDTTETCQYEFLQLIIGFLVVWSLSILVQSALIIVSLRGTILEDELRWHSEYLLYIKLGKYLFIHEVCPLPLHFFPI